MEKRCNCKQLYSTRGGEREKREERTGSFHFCLRSLSARDERTGSMNLIHGFPFFAARQLNRVCFFCDPLWMPGHELQEKGSERKTISSQTANRQINKRKSKAACVTFTSLFHEETKDIFKGKSTDFQLITIRLTG